MGLPLCQVLCDNVEEELSDLEKKFLMDRYRVFGYRWVVLADIYSYFYSMKSLGVEVEVVESKLYSLVFIVKSKRELGLEESLFIEQSIRKYLVVGIKWVIYYKSEEK